MKFWSKSLRVLALMILVLTSRSVFAQAGLRVGDVIEVRLAGVPGDEMSQFSAPYTVDDSGSLNLPYIGLMKVVGLALNQAQAMIENKLKADKIYTHPTITISPASNTRFVNIGGQVKMPGRIPYTADLKLMSAINAAGGFTDFADKKSIKVTRDNKVNVYNGKDLSKHPEKDIPVLPGDQIEVPQTWF